MNTSFILKKRQDERSEKNEFDCHSFRHFYFVLSKTKKNSKKVAKKWPTYSIKSTKITETIDFEVGRNLRRILQIGQKSEAKKNCVVCLVGCLLAELDLTEL